MSSDGESDSDRYIPADIRRAVLLEAGHACAIPTCHFPATEFAHIVPFAQVKKHEVQNIVALCPNHHHLFDQKKVIDRKAMQEYKRKLQFLNQRYTKYELRLLALLADSELHLAAGEIETMGLMMDGLIENAHTYETQDIVVTDNATGKITFKKTYVQQFAARLTPKGKEFVTAWRSSSDNLLEAIGRVE